MELFLSRLIRKLRYEIKNYKFRLFTPRFPKIVNVPGVSKLGSLYGQKYLVETELGVNPILVSGGVGEDISFDIEFLNKFGGVAYLFDPTERSVTHFNHVNQRFGRGASASYTQIGIQPIDSYDLSLISPESITFFPLALLDAPKRVRFYEPRDESHVSFSIQNIQNHFGEDGRFTEVDAIGPEEMVQLIGTRRIDILKLDIEGSELFFLASLFKCDIYPEQILVEIDELSFPSLKSRKIAQLILRLLEENQYELVYRDGFDFTYLRILNR